MTHVFGFLMGCRPTSVLAKPLSAAKQFRVGARSALKSRMSLDANAC